MTDTIARIAITPGEPAGIGPDLTVMAAQQALGNVELVAVADSDILKSRAKSLGLELSIIPFDPSLPAQPHQAGTIKVLQVKSLAPGQAGELNAVNAIYVLRTLETAAVETMKGTFDAILTAPVHKGVINDAGIPFSGHTEFFEAISQTEKVVMMLATEGLRVALATTHLALKDIPAAITPALLEEVIDVLHHDLVKQFNLPQPTIYVCGLNPHAGENGHMGMEEIETITPTLEKLRKEKGYDLIGPLPADTLFQPKYLEDADAILAMYHDQGLPVLKYKGFGKAVNITLGLPFIRTSVDHGTALDLAGTGKVDTGSFFTALEYAKNMILNKKASTS